MQTLLADTGPCSVATFLCPNWWLPSNSNTYWGGETFNQASATGLSNNNMERLAEWLVGRLKIADMQPGSNDAHTRSYRDFEFGVGTRLQLCLLVTLHMCSRVRGAQFESISCNGKPESHSRWFLIFKLDVARWRPQLDSPNQSGTESIESVWKAQILRVPLATVNSVY